MLDPNWEKRTSRLQFSLVQSLSHVWLCDPMDCSMPGYNSSSCSIVSNSLPPHELQHSRLPCPSPTLRACSNTCPSWWGHPTVSSCHPLLLLPSILPSIRVFSNESVLCITWPKFWSFSFSISPSNAYSGLIPLGLTGLISLQSKGLARIFSSTTITWNYT